MFTSQATLTAAFADLDSLLAKPGDEYTGPACRACGSIDFDVGHNAGQCAIYYQVCTRCGCVDYRNEAQKLPRKNRSNYKRLHHFHERLTQILLCESQIPDHDFLQIAERLLDGSYTVLNKDNVRAVLRSLKMQVYIEKWLQIIQRISSIEPPKPGGQLLMSLDEAFQQIQEPFRMHKPESRKNFLNYNYVFCRLFQRLGVPQFAMFFPLIKSPSKLKALDAMWVDMTSGLGWEFTPLVQVPPFSVTLQAPVTLLQQIRARGAAAVPPETSTTPLQTEFRKSDQRLLHELDRQTLIKQRRSAPIEPVPQRQSWLSKRPRHAVEARLLQPIPVRRRQRLE